MNEFLGSVTSRLFELFDPRTLGAGAADMLANMLVGLATFPPAHSMLIHGPPQ